MGGGHAGHNGLRNIDSHIGKDYARVRLGVGHPGEPERVTDHVLDSFSKADRTWLTPLIEAVAEAAPHLAKGDGPRFLTQVALILKPDTSKPGTSKKDEPHGI